MIKLLAWEGHAIKDIAHRREEELKQIKKGRILDRIMGFVNSVFPLMAKLGTIITYVCSSPACSPSVFIVLNFYRLWSPRANLRVSLVVCGLLISSY